MDAETRTKKIPRRPVALKPKTEYRCNECGAQRIIEGIIVPEKLFCVRCSRSVNARELVDYATE